MRYKVGQRVLVRKDLCYELTYYMDGGVHGNGVVSSMINLKGQVATISKVFVNGSGYTLKEDRGDWTWTDEMLELSNEITLTQMNKKKQEEKEKEEFGERMSSSEYLTFDSDGVGVIGRVSPGFRLSSSTAPFSREYISRWLSNS